MTVGRKSFIHMSVYITIMPKHHATVYLKYAIAFMWYKLHHKSEFDAIIGGK